MARLFKSTLAKVALGVGAVTLGAGGVLIAVEGTSAAATPVVNHQLCYTASATGFKPPVGTGLVNQFGAFGINIRSLVVNCNPVQKTITTSAGQKITPITNPNAHLACFAITAQTQQPVKTVSVTNQFGTATLTTGQPDLLCLPTWKSLTGPPKETVNQPPYLSHFTCYLVSYVAGTTHFKVPGTVSLKDEFGTAKSVDVGAPSQLCLPTEKILASGKIYKPTNTVTHLLCFNVGPTPIKPVVYDLNQFGSATVKITKARWLCLPSTKKVISTGS
jgi:hypothetical protein